MCGVGGIVHSGALNRVNGMIDRLAHRGPDDAGLAQLAPDVVLVHTRLAIQDLDQRSRCPFDSGDTTIVYNGELWNAAEVKADLVALSLESHNLMTHPPIVFETTGDTEVVAAALDAWGPLALPKLEGMFAIAWAGAEDGVIYLARDRFGEVPLHLAPIGQTYNVDENLQVADGYVFASELKAIAGVAPLGSAVMVDPGCWIELRRTANGRWRAETHRWYEAPAEPRRISLELAGHEMRNLMRLAVAERSVSDVPVCTLLSGGIDSTAVAYHLKDHFPDLVAYTAVFNPKSQDARMARLAADRLGIELREVVVPLPTNTDLHDVIRRIEMPYKAQVEIAWPCLWLARQMQEDGFKVCYSGEGSDELWASYGFSYHVLQRTFKGRKVFGQEGANWDQEAETEWCRYRRDTFRNQHRKNFPRCNKVFMAHGVECRLPFLHTSLVEFALSMPVDVCMVRNSGKGPSKQKAVMYEAWQGLVPDEIVKRHKVAFQEGMGLKDAIAEAFEMNGWGGGDPKVFYNKVYKEVYR